MASLRLPEVRESLSRKGRKAGLHARIGVGFLGRGVCRLGEGVTKTHGAIRQRQAISSSRGVARIGTRIIVVGS